jgi:predicted phage gp36 major capsid-like protein
VARVIVGTSLLLMAMHGHRRAELKSLALHREVARRLRDDPSHVEAARAQLVRWGERMHEHYRARWEQVLAGSIEDICALLEADTEEARDLRQCTPFVSVLDNQTRWRLLREVEEAWTAASSST